MPDATSEYALDGFENNDNTNGPQPSQKVTGFIESINELAATDLYPDIANADNPSYPADSDCPRIIDNHVDGYEEYPQVPNPDSRKEQGTTEDSEPDIESGEIQNREFAEVAEQHGDGAECSQPTDCTVSGSSGAGGQPEGQELGRIGLNTQPVLVIHRDIKSEPPGIREMLEVATEKLLGYEHNDTGVAQLVRDCYGHRIRVSKESNEINWYAWDLRKWLIGTESMARIRSIIVKCIDDQLTAVRARASELSEEAAKVAWGIWLRYANRYKNASQLDAVAKRMRDDENLRIPIGEWNRDDMAIQLEGGWNLNLVTGRIRPTHPDDLMTRVANVRGDFKENKLVFDPLINTWYRVLVDIFKGDQELIDVLGLLAYYTMTGHSNKKKLILNYGPADCGKSLVQKVLMAMLGSYAATGDFSMFEAKAKRDLDTTYAYDRICGVRMLGIDEASSDQVMDGQRIKQAVGGTEVIARASHGKQYAYTPKWVPWLSTNNIPTIKRDEYNFLWPKLHIIPYERVYEEHEQDSELDRKLMEKLEDVLSWVMSYRERYLKEGIGRETEKMLAVKGRAKGDMDYLQEWIDECLESCDEGDGDGVEELLENYIPWCKKNGYKFAMNKSKFRQTLREKGIVQCEPEERKNVKRAGKVYKEYFLKGWRLN